jgi:hypothetical protein
VLQVIYSSTSTEQVVNTGVYTDLTSITFNITPSSTLNKILILVNIQGFILNTNGGYGIKMLRDATAIYTSGQTWDIQQTGTNGNNGRDRANWHFYDTPSSTSSITYKVQVATQTGGVSFQEGNYFQSSITGIEIAG